MSLSIFLALLICLTKLILSTQEVMSRESQHKDPSLESKTAHLKTIGIKGYRKALKLWLKEMEKNQKKKKSLKVAKRDLKLASPLSYSNKYGLVCYSEELRISVPLLIMGPVDFYKPRTPSISQKLREKLRLSNFYDQKMPIYKRARCPNLISPATIADRFLFYDPSLYKRDRQSGNGQVNSDDNARAKLSRPKIKTQNLRQRNEDVSICTNNKYEHAYTITLEDNITMRELLEKAVGYFLLHGSELAPEWYNKTYLNQCIDKILKNEQDRFMNALKPESLTRDTSAIASQCALAHFKRAITIYYCNMLLQGKSQHAHSQKLKFFTFDREEVEVDELIFRPAKPVFIFFREMCKLELVERLAPSQVFTDKMIKREYEMTRLPVLRIPFSTFFNEAQILYFQTRIQQRLGLNKFISSGEDPVLFLQLMSVCVSMFTFDKMDVFQWMSTWQNVRNRFTQRERWQAIWIKGKEEKSGFLRIFVLERNK